MSLRKAELKPIQRFLESRIFNNLTLRETYFIERGTSPEIGVSLQNIRARNLTLRTYWERFDRHLRELNCESLQQLSLMGLTTTNLRPLSELIGRQSNIELKLNFGNPVLHKANADSTAAFQVLAKTPNLCQSLRSLKSHDIRSVAELDGIESLSSLRRLGLNFDSAFDFSTLSLSIFTAIAHLKLEKLTLSFWKLNIHLTLLSPFSGRGLFELTQCLMNKGASSSHSRLKAEKIKINQLESNKMEAVLQCFETSQLRILELRYRPIDLQQNAMDRYLAAVVRFLERCHNLSGFQIDLRGATKKSIAGILGSPCLKTCEEIGITVDEESLAWTTEFLKARPRTQFQEVTLRPTRFRRPPRWYFQP